MYDDVRFLSSGRRTRRGFIRRWWLTRRWQRRIYRWRCSVWAGCPTARLG